MILRLIIVSNGAYIYPSTKQIRIGLYSDKCKWLRDFYDICDKLGCKADRGVVSEWNKDGLRVHREIHQLGTEGGINKYQNSCRFKTSEEFLNSDLKKLFNY